MLLRTQHHLCYDGLIVQGDLTKADGHAERKAALDMINRHSPGSTWRLTLASYDMSTLRSGLKNKLHTVKRLIIN